MDNSVETVWDEVMLESAEAHRVTHFRAHQKFIKTTNTELGIYAEDLTMRERALIAIAIKTTLDLGKTKLERQHGAKPFGYYRCRACKVVWAGSQLYQDSQSTVQKWACGDLQCGATVDVIPPEKITKMLNTLQASEI